MNAIPGIFSVDVPSERDEALSALQAMQRAEQKRQSDEALRAMERMQLDGQAPRPADQRHRRQHRAAAQRPRSHGWLAAGWPTGVW